MVTRAINLKIIVPRAADQTASAKALWVTHREVNLATRYYEELLLSLRQRPILYRDETQRDAAEAAQVARDLADDARRLNSKIALTNYEDALGLLRKLYEAIVPSSIGEKGTAQNANSFTSPLLDQNSEGFQAIFDKIANPPNWIAGVRDGEVKEFEAAQSWLNSVQGNARLQETGAPPKWKKEALKKNKDWPEYFVEDYDKKVAEADGIPTLIRDLRKEGLLPLTKPYFASRIEGNEAAVTRWDRLAIRLAVAHLLSWESWVSNAATEHEKRIQNVEGFKARFTSATLPEKVDRLRTYEAERLKDIVSNSKALGEAPTSFRINQRMVRGWDDLLKRWMKHPDAADEDLLYDIATEQTKKGGKFGDPHFYRWLAKISNRSIWLEAEEDPIQFLANLNAIEALVERSNETATMTLPDARQHPRSTQWEPKGGNNFKNFNLTNDPSGGLALALPLLKSKDDGGLMEETLEFAIAPSDQMQEPKLTTEGKKISIDYKQSSGENSRAVLGSADLMLKWSYVRNRELELVERGDIGPVFLKVALDIEKQVAVDVGKIKSGAIYHFQNAAGKKTKHAELVEPGMRVLSVDLGLRSFATCSVFELQAGDKRIAPGKIYFPISDLGFNAVHERSFTLKLPGEDVGRRGRKWQADADKELREMRRALGRHRSLRRLNKFESPDERLAALTELQERTAEGGWAFEEGLLSELEPLLAAPHPMWVALVNKTARGWRLSAGSIVSDWRKRQRNKDDRKYMGKSIWSLDHLDNSRKFLLSWSLLGRDEGDIRRLDRERSGIFAANLLNHIAGVKADRIKTGADLLVQAARGIRSSGSGPTYPACQFILFEDLSRYKMRTDRSRRENSQLAKWSHREALTETTMQAELYGINIADTGAAFSSRYYALNSAPGVRATTVRKQDLENAFFQESIARENPHIDVAKLKAGDLVLRGGGEDFITLKKGKICRLQADVNAAQNLQRRLWTRNSEAIRIVTKMVTIEGVEHWVPSTFGARIPRPHGTF